MVVESDLSEPLVDNKPMTAKDDGQVTTQSAAVYALSFTAWTYSSLALLRRDKEIEESKMKQDGNVK